MHAVVVRMPADGERASVREVKEKLVLRVAGEGAGYLDSVGISPEGLVFYLYGPDADRLSNIVASVTAEFRTAGSYAIKRYGGPGALQVRRDFAERPTHFRKTHVVGRLPVPLRARRAGRSQSRLT